MADNSNTSSLLEMLTKPKGALIAAPLMIGAALFFSLAGSNDVPAGKNETANAVSSVADATGTANNPPKAAATAPAAGAAKAEATSAANGAAALNLASMNSDQREAFGKLVREYLLANPDLLTEIEQRRNEIRAKREEEQRLAQLKSDKDKIFRSPHDFVLGNENGDITVVEYFDYNCGWCKRALNEVANLAKEDNNVRIVMKEFPIFGEHSTFAAKAAMAARKQGKYWDLHVALMRAERVTTHNTLDIAKSVGIDVDALKEEMKNPIYDQAIAENTQIATQLGMQGTPAFIVDSQVNFGYVPLEGLKQMLASIRKAGCKIC